MSNIFTTAMMITDANADVGIYWKASEIKASDKSTRDPVKIPPAGVIT